jgi:membrane-associated protease RseP (regulator of RpoE activity)
MNLDLLFALIFYGLLFLFFLKYRSKFEVQNGIFALYKTKLGLNLMDYLGKRWTKFWKILGMFGVGVCFLGLFSIIYILIKGTYDLIFVPDTAPAVALVLPGVPIPGLGITLGFWHWIIGILVVAVVHEFGHGLYARVYNLKVKSSGFAFMGPILAAFVEPDEEELKKSSKKAQLSVYMAGPFFNILLFLVLFMFATFIFNPLVSGIIVNEGVTVYGMEEGYPMNLSGVQVGEEIKFINGACVTNVEGFVNEIGKYKPNDTVKIITSSGAYNINLVQHPDDPTKGYLGVYTSFTTARYSVWYGSFLVWLKDLIFWVMIISFGIGLFNLLPLGPVDGGRMFYTVCLFFTTNEKKVKKVWTYVSFFCLSLIVINLGYFVKPYLFQFFNWIIHLFI